MRTVDWDSTKAQVKLIDQRRLPGSLVVLSFSRYQELAEAIRNMTVRGAPAIGVTAAFGVVLAAWYASPPTLEEARREIGKASELLRESRPTAVNLFWALDRILRVAEAPYDDLNALRQALLTEALRMAEEDVQTNRLIAMHGSALIEDGDTIIHHCNTGALAAVDWGTALGCIRMAHEQGKRIHVLVDETRPRLQGARLTAWELEQYGISYEIICDSAAGAFLRGGKVQKVFFGADRVAANGDVANKIGTYMLSLAAHANNVPVVAVMPLSTIDLHTPRGEMIPIEERDPAEVLNLQINGEPVVPKGARARNPAFDVTPHTLISAWVTERGVITSPFDVHFQTILETGSELI